MSRGGNFTLSTATRIKDRIQRAGDATATPASRNDGHAQSVSYGNGEGYADYYIDRSITIGAGSSVTYDLQTGTDLKSIFNETATLAAVKSIAIWVDADTGDESGVRIGGAASNCWLANFSDTSDMATVFPGGAPWCAGSPAGLTVSSTAKNLKLENLGAAAATVTIKIAGSSRTTGMLLGILGMTCP